MLVVHEEPNTASSIRQLSVGVPEQTLPVAELAGTWNLALWQPVNIDKAGNAAAVNAEFTVDATGQVTALKGCLGLFACVASSPPFGKFVTNPSGGFDVVDGNGSSSAASSCTRRSPAGKFRWACVRITHSASQCR